MVDDDDEGSSISSVRSAPTVLHPKALLAELVVRANRPHAHLLVIAGPRSVGRVLPLAHDDQVVGRTIGCEVMLEEDGISRRHARIHVRPTGVSIEDLDSKNGTFVNGQRIAGETAVHEKDVVQIGDAAAMLVFLAAPDPRRAPEQITGLHSRQFFAERLAEELGGVDTSPVVLALVAIDGLGRVAIEQGEPTRAAAIRALGTVLREISAVDDERGVIAQVGDEVQAVVLVGVDPTGVETWFDCLRAATSKRASLRPGELPTRLRVGSVIAHDRRDVTVGQLFDAAERALHAAHMSATGHVARQYPGREPVA